MCNVCVSVQIQSENTNYSRYFQAGRELIQGIRVLQNHEKSCESQGQRNHHPFRKSGGTSITRDCTDAPSCPRLCRVPQLQQQQWLLLLFCLLNLSLAESKSKSCHQRILRSAVSRVPAPQQGKRLSKTVIRLRTIRQYPAGIQYPGAEITPLLFSHSAPCVLADRPALSRQEMTRPLTSGQREKLRLLKCTLHQRNSPARSHYSKAHNQQNEECTLLKESTIPKVAAIFSKGVAFSTVSFASKRMYETDDIYGWVKINNQLFNHHQCEPLKATMQVGQVTGVTNCTFLV